MSKNQIVDSSFTAIINAPIDKIDIPEWCFGLSEQEYQGCSPAHIAAGFTAAPDGKRMSINVEIIGGSMIVEHYIETLGRKDHDTRFNVRCFHPNWANNHSRNVGIERHGRPRREV